MFMKFDVRSPYKKLQRADVEIMCTTIRIAAFQTYFIGTTSYLRLQVTSQHGKYFTKPKVDELSVL
jgi:hypothetical protein